ncbi:MAG: transposase [Candidatus Hodarchaeota archaeon]
MVIQELISLGLMQTGEVLREEVKALVGERYKRNGKAGHVRWTEQCGSVYIGEKEEGKAVILGFIQAGTENASVCKDFLNSLLERGLMAGEGVFWVMDGSKGIRKAVEEVFVECWKNSNQNRRWLATAILDREPRLDRIRRYRYLPELRTAIQMELSIKSKEAVAV